MDQFQRGRSSSTQRTDIKPSHSPSPHPIPGNHNNALGIDPLSLQTSFAHSFSSQPTSTQALPTTTSYFDPPISSQQGQRQDIVNYEYLQAQGQQQPPLFNNQQGLQISNNSANLFTPDNPFDPLDDLNFGSPFDSNQDFDSSFALDPSLLQSQQDSNFLGSELIPTNGMATMHQHSPEAPHMLQPHVRHLSVSSANSSQFPIDASFTSSYHSRHASLDPSSAAFPQGMDANWNGTSFTHRRTPSQHSEASSAHHSPFLLQQDSFESVGQHSPMLNGNHDPLLLQDMNSFTISDAHRQTAQHISPAHSPHISPYLGPQQIPLFTNGDGFGQSMLNSQSYNIGPNGSMFTSHEEFPSIEPTIEGSDFGQMSPPAINIDFAPPTRPTMFSSHAGGDSDALVVPERTSHSNRTRDRARSESFATSSRSRGSSPGRSRSPSVGVSPQHPYSPRPSEGPPSGIHKSSIRRSSSPAAPAGREQILRIVGRQPSDPDISGSGTSAAPSTGSPNSSDGGNGASVSKRNQKHPSTFHCHLCSKSFTRAYNLRSHLRTHTDERPFVCTVCKKAFARQHDRKRHESLHSGEKKFVCRGDLVEGEQWGCGRGFARADALGRHFRSEAGRACIKPLLDEEARERQLAAMDQANHDMLNGQPPQPSMLQNFAAPLDPSQMPLPAALLQMYPALADLWYTMGPSINEDDLSGMESDMESGRRNSFDANSGNEYFDEDNKGLGVLNGMATSYPHAWQ